VNIYAAESAAVASNPNYWDYAWAVLSFAVGGLAAFPDIQARYPTDSLPAAKTLPGVAYLVSRGLLPAAVFVLLHYRGTVETWLPLWAFVVGTATEAVLRSQILLKQQPKTGGGIDEFLVGPLDLLRKYQDIFFEAIEGPRARARLRFVRTNTPTEPFKLLCGRVLTNAGAFNSPLPGFEAEIKKLEQEFDSEGSHNADVEDRYRRKLGFVVLRFVAEANYTELFHK
jgi:hypothetical protein